jgi:hypothetical protein
VPPVLSLAVIVYVIELAVGVAELEENVKQVPPPEVNVIVAVTVAPVLYENPDGAVSTIVPLPVEIARPLVSLIVGPVSVVHVAVPFVVLVSALMALPPVAGAAVTAASAMLAPAKNKIVARTTRKALFLCVVFNIFLYAYILFIIRLIKLYQYRY